MSNELKWIDTHAHYNHKKFPVRERTDILSEMHKTTEKIINVGTNTRTNAVTMKILDMHDFVYELLTTSDARRKPIDPLGRPHARFAVSGRDKYAGLTDDQKRVEMSYDKEHNIDDNAMLGSPQISVGDNYIDVYARNEFRFNDIKEICEKYGFQYEGPKETYKKKRNKFMMTSKDEWLQYDYTFRVYVPCDEDGIPLRIEDYFEPLGYQLEDVMNPEFCRHYRKIQKKIEKEAEEMLAKKEKERAKAAAVKDAENLKHRNDTTVKEIYEKHLHRAGSSNDPLEGFIKDMFDELEAFTFEDGSKLKYSKSSLKNDFLHEFEDDFEDEE